MLYLATISSDQVKVKLLVEKSDWNASNTEMEWTALHYAVDAGCANREITTILCENGANANKRDATDGTAFHVLMRHNRHHPVGAGDIQGVLLNSFGGDLTAQDFLDLTPINYHFKYCWRGFFSIVGHQISLQSFIST